MAGVDVRGAAPGTRETDLLNPVNTVERVNAIVLAGGSAFGLDAATGVHALARGARTRLRRRRRARARSCRRRSSSTSASATRASGRRRLRVSRRRGRDRPRPVAEGSIGAGAGATVGKAFGMARAMKGGVGSAAIRLPDGLIVSALVAVNAVGDVVDPATGQLVAGVRTEDGKSMADVRTPAACRRARRCRSRARNTTLAVVATNARLTKTQTAKVAQMAHDGFARAIVPVHTPVDGDTAFAIATGTLGRGADLLARRIARGRRHGAGHRLARSARRPACRSCRPRAISRADADDRSTVWLLAVFVAVQIGVGLWIGRRLRGAQRLLRRRPSPAGTARLRDVSRGEHRRRLDDRRREPRLSHRPRRRGGGMPRPASARWSSPLWAGPRLWRIARDRGFLTLGDYLEWRYGGAVRGVGRASSSGSSRCRFSPASCLARRRSSQVVAGLPRWAGALAAAVVVVIYFVAGGPADLGVGQPGAAGRQARGVSDLRCRSRWRWSAAGSALSTARRPAGRFSRLAGAAWIAAVVHRAARAGVHRLARAGPEGVRRRSARAVRIGVGVNAVGLIAVCDRARDPRHGGSRAASGTGVARSGVADAARRRSATAGRSADAGRRLRGRDQRGRRGPVHAVHVVVAGSLSALPRPRSRRRPVLRVARGSAIVAGVAGLGMALVLPTVVDALEDLLQPADRRPLRAGRRRSARGPRGRRRQRSSRSPRATPLTLAMHVATAGRGVAWLAAGCARASLISAASFAAVSMLRRRRVIVAEPPDADLRRPAGG